MRRQHLYQVSAVKGSKISEKGEKPCSRAFSALMCSNPLNWDRLMEQDFESTRTHLEICS